MHLVSQNHNRIGKNVNQMNHDLVEVNGFDIVTEHFPLQERAFMCMRLVTNFLLTVRLRKGVGRGDGRKEREDIHTY